MSLRRWRSCIIIVVIMLSPLLVLISQYPSATELVKLRNAMVFNVIFENEADWPGTAFPESFRTEQAKIPATLASYFHPINAEFNAKDMEYLLAHTHSLNLHNKRKGGPIQSNTAQTISVIAEQHQGYCADYTQVINVLAYAAGVPVREWAIAFDGFGGHGHAFNEIWDDRRQQWVMLDVFNGFYPVNRNNQQPLSVLAFRRMLQHSPEHIQLQLIPGSAFGFRDEAMAIRYFQRGANQFYLWWANDDLTQESSTLLGLLHVLSMHLGQLVSIVTGKHPQIKAISQPENQELIDTMLQLKHWLWWLFYLELLLLSLLLICLYRALKSRTGS